MRAPGAESARQVNHSCAGVSCGSAVRFCKIAGSGEKTNRTPLKLSSSTA